MEGLLHLNAPCKIQSRVVILRADHLGDMILTTPLVRALGEADYGVTCIGRKAWAGVWETNPFASYEPIEHIAPDWPRDWWKLGLWLRRQRFDHLLVPYYHSGLLLASAISGISHRVCQMGRILGRVTGHQALRSHIVQRPRYMADVWLDFARSLGLNPQSSRPDLYLQAEERSAAQVLLQSHLHGSAPLLVVHPFHQGSTCHIPVSDYATLVSQILQRFDCRVVITGTREDLERSGQGAAFHPSPRLWLSCGQLTLRELFAVIASAKALVVGSTGPLHIASAVGTPAFSGFCPHPSVGVELWGNPVLNSQVVNAPTDRCARMLGHPPSTCTALSGTVIPELLTRLERFLRPARD